MAAIPGGNAVDPVTNNMVTVTVAPNKRLTMTTNGFHTVYLAGETCVVPAFETVYLRRDGVIV